MSIKKKSKKTTSKYATYSKETDKYISNRGNGIFQSANNLFDVRATLVINGKQVAKKRRGIRNESEARMVRHELLTQLHKQKSLQEAGDKKWEEALAEYIAYLETDEAKNTLSASTINNHKTVLKAHSEGIEKRYLSQFTPMIVENHILTRMAKYSAATRKNFLKYMKAVFEFHRVKMLSKAVEFNPCNGVKIVASKAERKVEAMTKEEVQKLLLAVRREKSPWFEIYVVAFYTGCRSGELKAMKWSSVNFKDSIITISESYCTTSKKEKMPKNGKSRTVPMNADLSCHLRQMKKKAVGTYVLDRDFEPWRNGKAAKILRQYQRKLGITQTNFHAFRSSFITSCLRADVPPVIIMEIVGHSDFKTFKRYVTAVGKIVKGSTVGIDLGLTKAA